MQIDRRNVKRTIWTYGNDDVSISIFCASYEKSVKEWAQELPVLRGWNIVVGVR